MFCLTENNIAIGSNRAPNPPVETSNGIWHGAQASPEPTTTTAARPMPAIETALNAPFHRTMDDGMLAHLNQIIEHSQLTALFQPIVDLGSGEIAGYEGLIRGPSDSPLHSPQSLFKSAAQHQLGTRLEYLCRRVVLEKFAELELEGRLFLNVSPESMIHGGARHSETLQYMKEIGISPTRVIIELTESQPTYDYDVLRSATMHYRDMGFQIAMDDLGEGFSGLRLWSELRPEFVKIDMHFIQGINHDPVKLQFVRSIQEIAEKSGCQVVAEGIETQAELLIVRDLNIAFGQGYHLARPNAKPATVLPAEVILALKPAPAQPINRHSQTTPTAIKLLRQVTAVRPDTLNEIVYEKFIADPELQSIPVVKNDKPVGMISRFMLIDRFARLYQRELYGKKPCLELMDPAPLLVDRHVSIQQLGNLIVEAERHHLANGFIITEDGRYLGMGTGHDLMREITNMQIAAARQANPLTQLPGNIQIDEQIEHLLCGKTEFYVCYCDLDHFKPFNDVYGFHKGDELIRMTSDVLSQFCNLSLDFIGHIGGDNFIILFQSNDWEKRCQRILDLFGAKVAAFFSPEDHERGGYFTEDRQGKRMFHPLTSLSLGVVEVKPDTYTSLHQIAAATGEVKKQAKKIPGNALFVDRRGREGAA
ncbi:MAG: GGDEF domain-containing protein [Thiobacillus sp.]|nr:GGDEF domain-containing protein [Thiobacillus sp.]